MKIRNFTAEGEIEGKILIGMIINDDVANRIASKWPPHGGLFRNKYANIIGEWVARFTTKHNKAPNKTIKTLFAEWVEVYGDKDKNSLEAIDRLLTHLSNKTKSLIKEINAPYLIDLAAKHFRRVQAEKFLDTQRALLEKDELDKFDSKINVYNRIEMGVGEGINFFQDPKAIQRAFEYKRESLIRYPGALGEFFGNALERDGLIAVWAAYKRGKSFWVNDIAYRASLQRRRTLIFQAGDLSEHQMLKRMVTRALGRPLGTKEYKYPTKIERDEDTIKPKHEVRQEKKELGWGEAVRKLQKIGKLKIRSKDPYLTIHCYPARTLTLGMVRQVIREYIRQHKVPPDVIIIDYPDIMNMSMEEGDLRDKITNTWLGIRTLTQEYHCLAVLPTQIKSTGLKSTQLDESHFADDARKLAHVTGTIAINQDSNEKKEGIYRLTWINLREDSIEEGKSVYCASCLSIANPCVKSTW